MKKLIPLLIFMFLSATAHAFECTEKVDHLSKSQGIPIICKVDSLSERKISADQAEDILINNSYSALLEFFDSYDKDFLREHIRSVYLFKNLKYRDIAVGGLSNGKDILVCLDNYSGSIKHVYLRTLFHEFSSNIYKAAPFYKKIQWKTSGSEYENNNVFLKKCLEDYDFCNKTSRDLLQNGFIKNYSRTNEENDFNVYAEMLYTNPAGLKALAKEYPLIKIKLNIVKSFYRSSGFTKKFPDEA
jgi:hypothetical protein